MSSQLYVSFFQSPSTSKRRAVIMTDLPKQKTDLQFLVVQMIESKGLPEDSVLGDIMKLDKTAIDVVQDWMEYKVGLESVYEVCIDSMRLPKNGSNKLYEAGTEEFVPEVIEDPNSPFPTETSKLNYSKMEVNPYKKKNTMHVDKHPEEFVLRKVNQPKDGI